MTANFKTLCNQWKRSVRSKVNNSFEAIRNLFVFHLCIMELYETWVRDSFTLFSINNVTPIVLPEIYVKDYFSFYAKQRLNYILV